MAQSVARQQLWWSLAESTARMDLVELEESQWMAEQEDEMEESMVGQEEQLTAASDRRL